MYMNEVEYKIFKNFTRGLITECQANQCLKDIGSTLDIYKCGMIYHCAKTTINF